MKISEFNSKHNFIAGLLAAILCEIIFGFSFFFTRRTVTSVHPSDLLSWRFVLASLIFSVGALTRLIHIDYRGKKVLPMFGIGLLFPGLCFLLETTGTKLTTASETGIIISTSSVMTLFLSLLILHSKPSKYQCFGIACAFLGTACCAVAKGLELSFSPLGYLLLFCGITCYSFYSVLSARLDPRLSAVERTYCIVSIAAVIYTSIALTRHISDGTLSQYLSLPFRDRNFLISVLYLGGCSSVFALFLCNFSIARIGAIRFSSFIGIETVTSIFAGVLILHESFPLMEALGAALVIAGVYLTNRRPELFPHGDK